MATVTQVTLTCDVCGEAKGVKTWTFGLDGKAYVIDLCRKDGNALGQVAAGYIAKARKVTVRPGQRRHGGRQRSRAASADGGRAQRTKVSGQGRVSGSTREQSRRPGRQAAKASEVKARVAGSRKAAKASRSRPQAAEGGPTPAARAADARQRKGIYVYGILPADIEVAADIPGVGEYPGLLRDVRFDGLAALISEVDLSRRLGSPADLRTYREILDATAAEVPILPLRFGTVLTSEEAVAEELLAARHDEFTAVLDRLEGRVEFQVKGRYVRDAIQDQVMSENKRAARLRDAIQGQDPDAARNARIELDQLIKEAVAAGREGDTRTLRQAMEGVCVASVAREPAHELDAFHVAFLVAVDAEGEVDRIIEDLAREWEGRIAVRLLGPMAAYDFAGTAQEESQETGRRR
jgi:Gas vesicle synthesis protein GvpL/GvpF/Lsr2